MGNEQETQSNGDTLTEDEAVVFPVPFERGFPPASGSALTRSYLRAIEQRARARRKK